MNPLVSSVAVWRVIPIALAISFLVGVGSLAIFASSLPIRDPYTQRSEDRLQPPSSQYWLGTDDLGRDLMSRAIYGGRYSLSVGLVAVGLAFLIGVPLGIVGGYAGGWIDRILMSIVEIVMAVPGILLALVMISILGPSLGNVMIAVGISQIPAYARQSRGGTLSLANQEFVLAARVSGTSSFRILVRHILPNVIAPVLVVATLGLGSAILEAAALSFLGLSGDPNRPEWGSMLNMTRERFQDQPWLVLVPGFAITASVLSFNVLGDALRDWLDPKSRRS